MVPIGMPYVPWYVLIMLCHNFLIGKGHTCALRTTCGLVFCLYVRTHVMYVRTIWYVYVYVRTYVLIMLCHNVRTYTCVRTYVHVLIMCVTTYVRTYNVMYVRIRVRTYNVMSQRTYVRTYYVRTYVLIMVCHNVVRTSVRYHFGTKWYHMVPNGTLV
jgi:hypothetical protein